MKHSLPIKALTLLFFVFSVTSFVLYRGGYFESESQSTLQGSHNGGTIIVKDSAYQQRKNVLKRQMMYSSKSIIIDDAKFDSLVDEHLQEIIRAEREKEAEKEAVIMPGSKSMIMREKKAKISDPPVTADTLKTFRQQKPKKRP